MVFDPIYGNRFRDICDFNFLQPNIVKDKEKYVIYSKADHRAKALEYIKTNKKYKFVLVTHNSDIAINQKELPSNLIHWYAQNLDCDNPKISPIPIGLENPHWHPTKMRTMKSMLKDTTYKRSDAAFAQFNPGTNLPVREGLILEIYDNNIQCDWTQSINGANFQEYTQKLLKYKYCFAPRGNGIDTHRLWEALYMGCIPVVKRHRAHEFENCDLPILFLDEWKDFKVSKNPKSLNFNSDMLTMSYWRNKICQSL